MSKLKCLIPYPKSIEITSNDSFMFDSRKVNLTGNKEFCIIAQNFFEENLIDREQYAEITNINLILGNEINSPEAYILEIQKNSISISFINKKGLFYALQTLKQLLIVYKYYLPLLIIKDEPAFSWRGLHIDVSRHFFDTEEIKVILNRMAELKLNKFHWHLTDDQGWRIESETYPLLHKEASIRTNQDGSEYKAYYTKTELKEVIDYAEKLMITVVPEIDLPGHTQAIISAYPELSCNEKKVPVWNEWGVSEKILCAGKNEVFIFLQKIIEEYADIFPGEYFHIGGDECPTTQWELCPKCNDKMKEKQYISYRNLQSDITLYLADILKKKNKTLIGWDEIADVKIPDDAILMCWRGDAKDAGFKAIEKNLKFILTPNNVCYFDWKQSDKPDEHGAFGVSDLRNIYNYDSHQFNTDLVLGIQGNIWTERIENFKKLCYMTFPRVIALAENAWTIKENKDYNRFIIFIRKYLKYYDMLGINYSKSNIENNNLYKKKLLISPENIISEDTELDNVSSVFNPGAVKIEEKFHLLLRVQNRGRETYLVTAESNTGKDFKIAETSVKMTGLEKITEKIYHIYDPRITYINGKILVVSAIDTESGCYLGLFETEDFKTIVFKGIISEKDTRNGVIFPEKINEEYYMLYRPNKTVLSNGTMSGSTICISKSTDLLNWQSQGEVFSGRPHYWDELIGSGPVPLKTKYGWLHIYHGVATHFASSNIYQAGFSFLALKNPKEVLFRSKYNFIEPREIYECVGQVQNVVFPTGVIAIKYDINGFVDDDSNIYIYYGCADTCVGLLKTNMRYFIESMYKEKK